MPRPATNTPTIASRPPLFVPMNTSFPDSPPTIMMMPRMMLIIGTTFLRAGAAATLIWTCGRILPLHDPKALSHVSSQLSVSFELSADNSQLITPYQTDHRQLTVLKHC